ncbi:HNH endonuclease signature motif containing protein [Haematobacter massiliensis]|uniref:HNH endonuclease signature motif containing protein n=1 Tax=Haematobacter massiliensis TaxID=195105 RepID=UPI0023F2E4E3|nr:HNH endonuclease signature motif containing protein [Haematobacter massiliensis]
MVQKLCAAPGCDELAEPGGALCADCLAERRARERASKDKAKQGKAARAGAAFYRTRRWREARLLFLGRHPLCADCLGLGLVVSAREVDHVRPHRGDARLMWDQTNWQALCTPCHSRKTAREVWHGGGDAPG